MATGLILAGGTGVRLGMDIPKQYLEIQGKPILIYCMEQFESVGQIETVIVVAAKEWQDAVREWAAKYRIRKLQGVAEAGASRQHSIWNGLQKIKEMDVSDDDIVIVHDAVRPCVKPSLLEACITTAKEADGAMPVLPVKNTVYRSVDGQSIGELLKRDELYAGQAPESFRFGKYYAIHEKQSFEALHQIRGSSEIACRCGMQIKLIPGDENNYKITTSADLQKFRWQVEKDLEDKL